ncbi:hypothetical protein R2103_05505 [Nitrosomonas sp. Is24]|uniref:hypothetical protein n=1 Tax=Nitrosomonas sp. Is24 TaxID=3080533 RepID=UPI00294B8E0F|nr:hypothetical protein [Nitrosomonas sp. Is24]MDV6341222.1 hypothetical protein [Nitrosomonas sp. Is24]
MEAAEIIEYLRQRELNVTLTDGDSLELSPAEKITHELIERLRKHKPAIIQELKREQRREKVLRMLAENPGTQRAFVTDTESDPDNVIMTLAIRNQASFEMLIPKDKYDGFAILEFLHKGLIQ